MGIIVGGIGVTVGALGMTGGFWQMQDALNDPWVTNRSYEQFNEDGHEWIHNILT